MCIRDSYEAIQDFDLAISLKTNNASSLYYRAISYNELSRLHNALDDLNQVLYIDPKLTNALFIRAEVHKKLGNIDEAILDYQYILRNEKNNTKAKKELIKTKRIKRP